MSTSCSIQDKAEGQEEHDVAVVASEDSGLYTIKEPGWCPKIFGTLIDDHDTHDVTFKTSDGGSVSAHRAMVAASSPVFRAMLYGNMKESSEKVIELKNVSSEILRYLLTFVYKGKVSFSMTNCLDLLDVAHYFGIDTLESLCVDHVYGTLTINNLSDITTFAHNKGYQGLLQKCLSYLCTDAIYLIKSPEFKDLPAEVVLTFFESSNVCAKEIELFTAAIEWYRNQGVENADVCNKLFELIRYPLISRNDLLDKVRPNQEKDMTLYTAALEYHIDAKKYTGPPQQLVARKPWFEIISVTPDTVILEKTKNETLVSRVGTNGWNGLCAIKVGPQTPQKKVVQFGLCLVSMKDPSSIQYSLITTNSNNLSCESFECDFADSWNLEDEKALTIKVYRTVRYGKPVFKLKMEHDLCKLFAPVKKDTPVFFCIHMHDVGDEVKIFHL